MTDIEILIPSQYVSRLKQQARQLKRQESISHSEALERIAHAAGFPHWKAVTEGAALNKPIEEAKQGGLVALFDAKEADDLRFPKYGPQLWPYGVSEWMMIDIQAWWATQPSDIEDDPSQRPNGEVFGEDEIEEICAELYGEMIVYVFPKIVLDESPLTVVEKLIVPYSFFNPWFVWLKGRFHSLST